MTKNADIKAPECASCGSHNTKLVTGEDIYPHRPDLYSKFFWRCECGAYCGCHNTKKGNYRRPLGRPADKELRAARGHCHRVFDPLWKNAHQMACYRDSEKDAKAIHIINKAARTRTYRYLAACMNLTRDECHIGMMDVQQCRQLYAICKSLTPEAIRKWHMKEKEAS